LFPAETSAPAGGAAGPVALVLDADAVRALAGLAAAVLATGVALPLLGVLSLLVTAGSVLSTSSAALQVQITPARPNEHSQASCSASTGSQHAMQYVISTIHASHCCSA
jgi:hypothetical protein